MKRWMKGGKEGEMRNGMEEIINNELDCEFESELIFLSQPPSCVYLNIILTDDICDDIDESSDDDLLNSETFNKEKFEKNLQQKRTEEVKVLRQEKDFMLDLQEHFEKDKFLGKSFYYKQKLQLSFESMEDIRTLDRLI